MQNEEKSEIFCILSKNIILKSSPIPRCAILIISSKTGKIVDIKELDENSPEFEKIVKMYKNEYNLIDFSNKFILPGIIDTCVYLNSDYHETWRFVRETSKTAAASGVTTVVDHPMMRQILNNDGQSEIGFLKKRIKHLKNYKKYTDVALMAHLDLMKIDEIQELMKMGIFGFSGYLMPIFQPGLRWLKQENLERSLKVLNSIGEEVVVSIFCDFGTGRELAISSPYRTKKLESRLVKGVKIGLQLTKDAYADGDVDSELKAALEKDASDKSGTDSLDEDGGKKEKEGEDESGPNNSTSIEPEALDSRSLKLSAIQNSKLSTLRNLSNLEIMSYTSCDSFKSKKNRYKVEDDDIDSIESPKFPQILDEHDSRISEEEESSPLVESPRNFHLNWRNSRSRSSYELDLLEGEQKHKGEEKFDSRPHSQREQSSSSVKKRGNFSEKKRQRASARINWDYIKNQKSSFKTHKINKLENPSTFKIKLQNTNKSSLLSRRKKFKTSLRITTKKSVLNPVKEIDKYRYKYSFYEANRPIIWQKKALHSLIQALKKLEKKPVFNTMLTNVTSASLISHIRDYNKLSSSRRISVNVLTPHIFFSKKKIEDGMTQFKFGQPIRDSKNKRHLINHHQIKSISCVASGHMYVPPDFKVIDGGCFIKSFNGFCSSGFILQSLWTSLVMTRVKVLLKYTESKFYFTEKEIRGLFKDFNKEIQKIVKKGKN